MNRGINLLKEKKQISLTPAVKKLYTLRLIAVGLLFTISTASVVLFLLIALSPLPALQKQEQNALRTLSQYHPDMAKMYLVDERIKTSKLILDKRRNFDKTFDSIRNEMPNGLSVTAFSIRDKDVSISVTSNSLSTLDAFINNLVSLAEQKKSISDAVLTSLIVNQQQGTFTLTVNMVTL